MEALEVLGGAAMKVTPESFLCFTEIGTGNITMPLNYYAHATFGSAKAEMERLIAA